MFRLLALAMAVVAVCLFTGMPLQADDKATDTHQGKVVNVTGQKLIMTDKDGKNEHTHTVALNARITCDGKECKLGDLKPGTAIRVTTSKEGDRKMATRIEANTKGFER
jgi:hypothetical protein